MPITTTESTQNTSTQTNTSPNSSNKTSNPFSALRNVSMLNQPSTPLSSSNSSFSSLHTTPLSSLPLLKDSKQKKRLRRKKKSNSKKIKEENKVQVAKNLCPLCCCELDETELHFKPCECEYKVCLYCWNRIMESKLPKCPNCRKPYSELSSLEQLNVNSDWKQTTTEQKCSNCLFRSKLIGGDFCKLCKTPYKCKQSQKLVESERVDKENERINLETSQKIIESYHVKMCELFEKRQCKYEHRLCFNSHKKILRRKPVLIESGSSMDSKVLDFQACLAQASTPTDQRWNYTSRICDYISKGLTCPDGDKCGFAHTNEEIYYHPDVFRTQMCEEIVGSGVDSGIDNSTSNDATPNNNSIHDNTNLNTPYCSRGIYCFKAHDQSDLRTNDGLLQQNNGRISYSSNVSIAIPNISNTVSNTAQDLEKDLNEPDSPRKRTVHNATTDSNFYMFVYKTISCQNRPCSNMRCCTCYHHEQERRRSPKDFQYSAEPCPSVKCTSASSGTGKQREPSRCKKGEACNYAHTLLEQMYHPHIYKTILCTNYSEESGSKTCLWGNLCTHGHGKEDLRIRKDPSKPYIAKNDTSFLQSAYAQTNQTSNAKFLAEQSYPSAKAKAASNTQPITSNSVTTISTGTNTMSTMANISSSETNSSSSDANIMVLGQTYDWPSLAEDIDITPDTSFIDVKANKSNIVSATPTARLPSYNKEKDNLIANRQKSTDFMLGRRRNFTDGVKDITKELVDSFYSNGYGEASGSLDGANFRNLPEQKILEGNKPSISRSLTFSDALKGSSFQQHLLPGSSLMNSGDGTLASNDANGGKFNENNSLFMSSLGLSPDSNTEEQFLGFENTKSERTGQIPKFIDDEQQLAYPAPESNNRASFEGLNREPLKSESESGGMFWNNLIGNNSNSDNVLGASVTPPPTSFNDINLLNSINRTVSAGPYQNKYNGSRHDSSSFGTLSNFTNNFYNKNSIRPAGTDLGFASAIFHNSHTSESNGNNVIKPSRDSKKNLLQMTGLDQAISDLHIDTDSISKYDSINDTNSVRNKSKSDDFSRSGFAPLSNNLNGERKSLHDQFLFNSIIQQPLKIVQDSPVYRTNDFKLFNNGSNCNINVGLKTGSNGVIGAGRSVDDNKSISSASSTSYSGSDTTKKYRDYHLIMKEKQKENNESEDFDKYSMSSSGNDASDSLAEQKTSNGFASSDNRINKQKKNISAGIIGPPSSKFDLIKEEPEDYLNRKSFFLSLNNKIIKLEKRTICPICKVSENLRDVALIPCGHSICKSCYRINFSLSSTPNKQSHIGINENNEINTNKQQSIKSDESNSSNISNDNNSDSRLNRASTPQQTPITKKCPICDSHCRFVQFLNF